MMNDEFDEVTHSEHFCNFDCHRWLLAIYRAIEFVPNHIVQRNRAKSKRIEIVFFVDVRRWLLTVFECLLHDSCIFHVSIVDLTQIFLSKLCV